MDTRKIRSFIAIMKYHNLADASEALFTSESAISKHIASLENEFGTQLFVRKKHGYYPTKAALIFNDYAIEYLDNYSRVVNRLNVLKTTEENILTIATTSIMSEYRITEYAYQFIMQHGKIKLNVIEAEADDVSQILYEGKANAAFVSKSVLDPAHFDMLNVVEDKFSVVLSVNHPLAKRKSISIDELKDERFIVPGTKSSQYHLTMNLCQRHGFRPNIVHSTERFDSLIDMVGYDFGICLLMTRLAKVHASSRVRIIPLTQHIRDCIALTKLKSVQPTNTVQLLWDYMNTNVNVKDTAER